jgi:RNA-directed DNA polymerase
VGAIWNCVSQAPKYVLDADIAKCFDRINHEALLNKLGTFPEMRRAIKAWLKAGIMDGGELFPTTEGTPQGGVISPLLANVALHGLASAIESAFQKHKCLPTGRTKWTPRVIRYADDFVVLHRDLEVIQRVKEIAAEWLKSMGLEMKPSKTRITHTLEAFDGSPGFDFLGFNVRQYARGKCRGLRDGTGRRLDFTTSIRPSAESQRRLLRKIREITHAGRAWTQRGLIAKINPILWGWGKYFSTVVSKDIFHRLDHLIFWKLWPWACRRHSNKTRGWIARHYWLHRRRQWNFEAKDGFALVQLSRTPIVRHIKVKGDRSPYDGDAVYWSVRMGKHPDLPKPIALMIKRQKGHCPTCGLYLTTGNRLAESWITNESSIGSQEFLAVVHEHCQGRDSRAVCDDNTPFC